MFVIVIVNPVTRFNSIFIVPLLKVVAIDCIYTAHFIPTFCSGLVYEVVYELDHLEGNVNMILC